ncbi:hypothetical protein Q4603_21875 [Zobellia galactanivorans]|uniref:hypothetical protein n=1 Tax=Zobellia galactanivorans (strain DSM 12802 / CCUG 47099 / CIP 106680 / NCIMB 13871 / Dsij) TaxID=63186 RepID=UPI0026E45D61|nr:hypothetical protein [Zobellia galactanivorans]MDO6811280.1 hypothetical protein [Zobellia galactanivorans]
MQTYLNRIKTDFLKYRENRWSFSFVEDEREENGIIYREFNNFPSKEFYSKIEAISFLVFEDDMENIDKLPDFLNNLPNLEILEIPIDWLCSLDIPVNIKALTLMNSINIRDKYKWCNDLSLLNLKYLSIPEQIKPFEINFANVPNLEWINLDLKAEKKANKLDELSKLKTLKHLNFSQAKDIDVFTPFSNHNIEAIELFACKGKKFPIQNIEVLKKLKCIRINNVSVDFDCTWLLKLSKLIEVEILNVKNLINVEELLKIDTLKSISILNCNNPIKNKEMFKLKNYELLRIDNA